MKRTRGGTRQLGVALRAMLILTVALGLIYPLLITGVGQTTLNAQANGSALTVNGEPVGSSLIGQSFTDDSGAALPQWFQSRPSAAGGGYDGGASSGSNWGPENPDFISAVTERRQTVAALEGVSEDQIPADALTASSSGLDPHISPEYALLQAPRIAETRGVEESEVRALVESATQGRDLGYLGDPTVNVLELNITLAELDT